MNKNSFMRIVAAFIAGGLICWSAVGQVSPTATLKVFCDKPGIRISPMLYGIFFEEINCAGDGGLYAELIRNRSFEESDTAADWSLVTTSAAKGEMAIDTSNPMSKENRHALRLTIMDAGKGSIGISNSGYWGISLKNDAKYDLSFYARCSDDFNGPIAVTLESVNGKVYARDSVDGITGEWKSFSRTLVAHESDPESRLVLSSSHAGTLWLDVVSLFPQNTFKLRANGLRQDLAQMVADLHPSFVRFPGGCWVEGESLKYSYRWKQTVGNIAGRQSMYDLWKYYSTNGLGFLEYLQMCEDMGATPLFVVNCGMSHTQIVPKDRMAPWVQDALDAVEYANGPVDSRWGSERAKNGHPAPFNLAYMEIGNENGGKAYEERYALFYDALKSKYPDIHLIANVWGGVPKSRPVEIVDEHYYSSPKFFITHADMYDTVDRQGPKVYVGEYAVTDGGGKGNLRGALGEAAFMTGLERNSDVVAMASYAPLFANIHQKVWDPDLINFNGAEVYGTPSYYVQKMFSENRGNVVLPVQMDVSPDAYEPLPEQHGKVGLGTWDTQAEYKDVRVTKDSKVLFESDFIGRPGDWTASGGDWIVVDGAYRQAADGPDRRSIAGDSSWKDYKITLKARKVGGDEGFLILFYVKNQDNWFWWNVGGWGNTRHAIEWSDKGSKSIVGAPVAGKVVTGQWYDVSIELNGRNIRCSLDGKLIHDVNLQEISPKPLHVSAGRDSASGEVILKVVNVSEKAIETKIDLSGIPGLQLPAKVIQLRSENPAAENSIAHPYNVVPVVKTIEDIHPAFQYSFPSFSLTILRVRESK